jgi:hypothetical protein
LVDQRSKRRDQAETSDYSCLSHSAACAQAETVERDETMDVKMPPKSGGILVIQQREPRAPS